MRDELKEINSTMDFNRALKRDLESDYDLLIEVLANIEKKETRAISALSATDEKVDVDDSFSLDKIESKH